MHRHVDKGRLLHQHCYSCRSKFVWSNCKHARAAAAVVCSAINAIKEGLTKSLLVIVVVLCLDYHVLESLSGLAQIYFCFVNSRLHACSTHNFTTHVQQYLQSCAIEIVEQHKKAPKDAAPLNSKQKSRSPKPKHKQHYDWSSVAKFTCQLMKISRFWAQAAIQALAKSQWSCARGLLCWEMEPHSQSATVLSVGYANSGCDYTCQVASYLHLA